ncbi:hypothetical protein CRUP_036563 [Coryphaenoides rupestris]|nr:hypothetical protein CRUP_036563 [Coryphaenoides rupestris]
MRLSAPWTALTLILVQGVLQADAVKKIGSNVGRFANATLVRLSEFLSAGYKKGVRPVKDWRDSTTVAIDLMIYSILNVAWTDEFLVWNPEDFDEVKQVSIPTANVWVPDILINEFVDVGKSPDIPYVYVTHEGRVSNYKPIQVVTACTLNIYNFPFDVQNCSLSFQSWLHTNKSLFMNQGEWELLHVLSAYKSFSLDNDDYYAEMKFHVVIRRRPLFYTVNLLLPSIFLMVMDVVGFYLPPDSGERVSFKVTLMLGYSVFLIIVSDTLAETVVIVRLVHKQDLQRPPPDWVKRLVLDKAPLLFCIHTKRRLCSMLGLVAGLGGPPHHHQHQHQHHHHGERDGGLLLGAGAGLGAPPPVMDSILQEVTSIRHFLEKRDACREIAKEWLQIGYVLDVLLFRVYLVAMVAYSITLGTLWSVWQVV